ncbi:MAG: inner membrane-spanning protein YciB [Pseudomonadales bacterium]
MSQLLDFIPIALFVIVYFTMDIYWATGALMVAVSLQVATYWLLKRPIGNELKLTFWASMIFGGLTLWLRDETFIQWKPTVINWAMGAVLLITQLIGKGNLIKKLLGAQLTLPEPVWARLTTGWGLGFLLAGALNLVVAYNFSMDFWISYKLIGGFAITFTYLIITMVYLSRGGYLDQLDPEAAGAEPVTGAAASNPPSTDNS